MTHYLAKDQIQLFLGHTACCFLTQQSDEVQHKIWMEAYENAEKSLDILQGENGVRLWAEWVTDNIHCSCVGELEGEERERTILFNQIMGEAFLKLIHNFE